MVSLLSFITGLTLLFVSAFFCYGTFTQSYNLDSIIVMLIVHIPIGLVGMRLIRNAIEEESLALYVICGGIWVGFLLLIALGFYLYQSSLLPPGSPTLADIYPINKVFYIALGLISIPLLIGLTVIVISAVKQRNIFLLVMLGCALIAFIGISAVGVGVYFLLRDSEMPSAGRMLGAAKETIWASAPPRIRKVVTVPANAGWYDTGIDVAKGETIKIEYINGCWKYHPNSPQYDGKGTYFKDAHKLMVPNIELAVLLGKVKNRTFIVGNYFDRAIGGDGGRLTLSMNDIPTEFADNSGELHVLVEIR